MLKPKLEKELFSSYSHMIGAIAAYVTTIILLIQSPSTADYKVVAAVFGICSGLVMTFSAVYHFNKLQDDEISFWRKVDHSVIFIVIAGTFTPLVYVYTTGAMKIGLLIGIWVFVFLGFLFKFKFMDAPRWMSLGVFVIMGLLALIPLNQLLEGLLADGPKAYAYFWTAIACIIAGILVYGFKKPDPKPGVFGFHDIWHILVILFNVFLFMLMFQIFTSKDKQNPCSRN